MPTGVRKSLPALPALPAFEVVKGETLVKVQAAARLGGVHPVALEMARKMTDSPTTGAAFTLGDKAMKDRAGDIETMLVKHMRKVLKAFGATQFRVRSYREADKLTFWLDEKA